MDLFDNIDRKLHEIRTNSFYKPYIDIFKSAYREDKERPVPELTYADFMTFEKNGSRQKSEKSYFNKRYRLGYLTMLALIYPQEQKYIDELCETVWSVCSEISWVIAAHLHCNLTEHKSLIDLFAAETGLYLSELVYLLGDRLPQNICDLIKAEVSLRIFDTMEKTTSWWEGLNSNWAAVCGGSVGMAYMYLAPDRFENVKGRIMKTMDGYLSGIGEDGCCSEGIQYWHYGFSFYLQFAEMLYRFTDGREDIRRNDKIERLAEFLQHMLLRNSTTVSFSDASRKTLFVNIGFLNYLKQHYTNVNICRMDLPQPENEELPEIIRRIKQSKPSWLIRDMLWSSSDLKAGEAETGTYKYYDRTQWYINKKKTYSFAAKAGHNGEQHNHNDIGSFIIATDMGQIIADIGAMEYTKEGFMPETMYKAFNRSSLGHSVPIVDGKAQCAGSEYSAKEIYASEACFKMDLQGAYETNIKRITRTFEIQENAVILTDEYMCGGFENHNITERFISVIKPEIVEKGVKIGNVIMRTDTVITVKKEVQNNKFRQPENIYVIDLKAAQKSTKVIFEIEKSL